METRDTLDHGKDGDGHPGVKIYTGALVGTTIVWPGIANSKLGIVELERLRAEMEKALIERMLEGVGSSKDEDEDG